MVTSYMTNSDYSGIKQEIRIALVIKLKVDSIGKVLSTTQFRLAYLLLSHLGI